MFGSLVKTIDIINTQFNLQAYFKLNDLPDPNLFESTSNEIGSSSPFHMIIYM